MASISETAPLLLPIPQTFRVLSSISPSYGTSSNNNNKNPTTTGGASTSTSTSSILPAPPAASSSSTSSASSSSSSSETPTPCPICLSPLQLQPLTHTDTVTVTIAITITTSCNHTFHAGCYRKWHHMQRRRRQKLTCPVCREEVDVRHSSTGGDGDGERRQDRDGNLLQRPMLWLCLTALVVGYVFTTVVAWAILCFVSAGAGAEAAPREAVILAALAGLVTVGSWSVGVMVARPRTGWGEIRRAGTRAERGGDGDERV